MKGIISFIFSQNLRIRAIIALIIYLFAELNKIFDVVKELLHLGFLSMPPSPLLTKINFFYDK